MRHDEFEQWVMAAVICVGLVGALLLTCGARVMAVYMGEVQCS